MWATNSIRGVRELFNSRTSLMHYCLQRIMMSLEGKSKTVQYRIAEDMNHLALVESINIYDLIQIYALKMCSVGESTTKPMMAIQDYLCFNCGEKGHHANTCMKPKKSGDKPNISSKKCTFCKWKGHTVDECQKKKAHDEKLALTQAEKINPARRVNSNAPSFPNASIHN